MSEVQYEPVADKERKEGAGAARVVHELMGKNEYTCAVLGKRIGVKNTTIWDRLYNKSKKGDEGKPGTQDLKVSLMVQMLRGMGYKLIAVPDAKPVQEGEYVLK